MKDRNYYVPSSAPRIDGNILYELRKKYGITRKEFAEWSGFSYRSIENWEKPYRNVSPLPNALFMLKAYILHKSGLFEDIEEKFKTFEDEHGILGIRRKAS